MEESTIQLNQSYYLRMEWELDEMKAGRVRLVEFHSHNCFEEFAVTLNKRVRVVIRGLTELNFFFLSSSSFDKSYMIRGATAPSPTRSHKFKPTLCL